MILTPEEEALDLTAEFIRELGHLGLRPRLSNQEFSRPFLALTAHPAYLAAFARVRRRLWSKTPERIQ